MPDLYRECDIGANWGAGLLLDKFEASKSSKHINSSSHGRLEWASTQALRLCSPSSISWLRGVKPPAALGVKTPVEAGALGVRPVLPSQERASNESSPGARLTGGVEVPSGEVPDRLL